MGRESGKNGSRDAVGRGASWVEKNLGLGWVEVEPGIYEFLLNEARTHNGLQLTVPGVDEPGKISRTTAV
jgi:hypothetical protein